jgi:DUF4097 and DUF4098 domain-containing protein YvlB
MKSIMIIAIPAVSIIVAMMVWIHLTPTSEGSRKMLGSESRLQESKTIPVAGAPTIIVGSDAGNVELVGGNVGSVHIEAEKHAPTKAEAEQMAYSVDERGNTIHIVYRQADRNSSNRHIDFKIQAPRDSTLQITTGGGNVEASGFSHGISGRTGGGNIRAVDVLGDVRLNTHGGNINGGGLNGAISLTTGGGNIEAFGELRGTVALRTGAGNISAESVAGEVKAQPGAGDIYIGGRLAGNSQLSTGSGDVDTIIPADSNLSVQAATYMGHIHDSFGLQPKTAQLSGAGMLSGQIGNGSNSLNINTGMGNVSIVKG